MNETGKNPFEPKQKGKAAVLYLNFLKHATIFALAVSVAFLLKACDKEENPTGRINMTTAASEVRIIVAGAKNIVIDWGNGKQSNVNDAFFSEGYYGEGYYEFSQNYSGATAHHIVITGKVTELYCYRNGLTALDVSRNKALTILICSNNQLTALDVSRNTALKRLDCYRNSLTALDVSRNTVLTELDCSANQLTALDVSKNTALKELECNYNQIKSLDMSNNTVLKVISCACNQLTASALNDLFRTLPSYPGLDYGEIGIIFISTRKPDPQDNPGIFDCDRSIAEEKGWIFRTIR